MHSGYWSKQIYLGWHLDVSATLETCGFLEPDTDSEQYLEELAVDIYIPPTTKEPDVTTDAVTEIINGNVTQI